LEDPVAGLGVRLSAKGSFLVFVVSVNRELGNAEFMKLPFGELKREENVEASIWRHCSIHMRESETGIFVLIGRT
jgi:hypothetical protein